MEYAKDIILNVGYKGIEGIRHRFYFYKIVLRKIKEILKKWTSIVLSFIKKNKFICITLSMLIVLISINFILIDNFFKLFLTLY